MAHAVFLCEYERWSVFLLQGHLEINMNNIMVSDFDTFKITPCTPEEITIASKLKEATTKPYPWLLKKVEDPRNKIFYRQMPWLDSGDLVSYFTVSKW